MQTLLHTPPITKISTERSIFPLMESICWRGNIRDKNMLPLEWELGSLSITDICAIIPREHKQKNFVCSNINVTGKLFGCFVHFHSFQFLRSPKSPRNFTISPLSRANLWTPIKLCEIWDSWYFPVLPCVFDSRNNHNLNKIRNTPIFSCFKGI